MGGLYFPVVPSLSLTSYACMQSAFFSDLLLSPDFVVVQNP